MTTQAPMTLAKERAMPKDASVYWRVFERLARPQNRADRLLGLLLLVLCLALGAEGGLSALRCLSEPVVYSKDFIQEFVLGRTILNGDNPYLPISTLVERYLGIMAPTYLPGMQTPHPPTLGLLLLPFSLAPYRIAAAAWLGVEILALAAAVYLLVRSEWKPRVLVVLVVTVALLGWQPMLVDMSLGQVTVLILLLLAGMRLASKSSRPGTAGLLLGLTLLVKPLLWPLFIVLLLYRQWRVIWMGMLTVLAGYTVTALVAGPQSIRVYLAEVLPAVNAAYRANLPNISLWSIGWRAYDGTLPLSPPLVRTLPVIHSETWAAVFSAAIPAAVLLLATCGAWRMRDLDHSFGLMIAVSIVISPIAWNHYHIVALVPIVQGIEWLARRRLPFRETSVALAVGLAFMLSFEVWVELAVLAAGQSPDPNAERIIAFLPSLVTLGPTWTLSILAVLIFLISRAKHPSVGTKGVTG